MKRSQAEILREYGPFPGVDAVHGLTYDGEQVWFATGDRLVAMDPVTGQTSRALDITANAGTAFDGTYLYQIADGHIQKVDPSSGEILSTIPAPGGGSRASALLREELAAEGKDLRSVGDRKKPTWHPE